MKGFITSVALPVNQAFFNYGKCSRVNFVRKISLNIFLLLAVVGFSQVLNGQITRRGNTPIVNAGTNEGSCEGLFTITTTKTYNAATNQTTYTWTVTRTGTQFALSHWGFPIQICPGSNVTVQQFLANIVDAQTSDDCANYHHANTAYQVDKSQDCTGDTPVFKFDEDMGNRTTQCFRLIVTGNWSIIPAIAYIKYGNHCCTFTINNPGCLQEECIPPPCSITGDNNICPGSTHTYSGPAGNDVYQWSVTGNATINPPATGQTVSVTAGAHCGSFTLTLSTRKNGCPSECSQTFNVTDNTPPTITATGNNLNAGCNPSSATINVALGSATATDGCGTPTITFSDASVSTNGCNRSQTRTFTATDACGNTATASRTATWTVDATPPTITATGNNSPLGCNPSTAAIDAALGSATATDACSTATLTSSTGDVISSGCSRSQTRTWTATDACGNTATASRTATWTVDVTAPTITATGTPA